MLQGGGEIGALLHCWDCKMVQLLWKVVWQFLKSQTRGYHPTPISSPRYLPKTSENMGPSKNWYTNIHNRQKKEAIQVCIH